MTDPQYSDNGRARRAMTYAVLSTLSYAALIIAVFGVLSVLLDRDVVEGTHSILVGLVMPIAAVAVVGVACLRGAQVRVAQERSGTRAGSAVPVLPSLIAGVLTWLGAATAGALVVATEDRSVLAGLGFLGERLLSPFTIAAGVCGWVIVLA
ncbi:MAG: hypothetical protein ACTJHU_08720, partial [Mycetocola sp.]